MIKDFQIDTSMRALSQTFSFSLKIVFIATSSSVQKWNTHQGFHAVKVPSSTELGWISAYTNKFFQSANLIWCHSCVLCLGICLKCRFCFKCSGRYLKHLFAEKSTYLAQQQLLGPLHALILNMHGTHISQHLSTGLGGKEVYSNLEIILCHMVKFLCQLFATSIGQPFQGSCIRFCLALQHREFVKIDAVGWFLKESLRKKVSRRPL